MLVALCVAVLGCGGFWEWWRVRGEKKRETVLRGELDSLVETSLRNSTTIKQLAEKIDRNTQTLAETRAWEQKHDEETHRHRLLGLRQAMMEDPHDRLNHEHQIEAGKEYLASGGNGIGHARYSQLLADYEWRMAHSDWDYTHRPPIDKTH